MTPGETNFRDYENYYEHFRVPGGRFLHEEPPYIQTLVAHAAVEAKALADVRTLESWADGKTLPLAMVTPRRVSPGVDRWWVQPLAFETGGNAETYWGTTPDEARQKAAAWVRGLK